MADETAFGVRDRRGNWTPFRRPGIAPIFALPPKPLAVLKWLFGVPGYLLPWNLFLFAVALGAWAFLTPDMETMRTFEVGWVAYLLVRNAALTLVLFGALHIWLYTFRNQGTTFKYNARWFDTDNKAFLFRSQTVDNMIWTFASGVPIWTAWEAVTLWLMANGYVPWLSFAENPIWFALMLLAIPMFREFHFYVIHRLIHWPPLYRRVHALHHKNVNPGPWSSLAMHPVEHLLYFSGVLIHWIIPSHPLHAILHLGHAGLGSVVGHIGFEKIVVGRQGAMDTGAYAHYLHHKYFEVNYADGSIPLDQVFGTFHDGSEEAHARMLKRRQSRMAGG